MLKKARITCVILLTLCLVVFGLGGCSCDEREKVPGEEIINKPKMARQIRDSLSRKQEKAEELYNKALRGE